MNPDSYKLYSLLKSVSECCHDREILQAKLFGISVPELRCVIAIKLEGCRTTSELAEKLCLAKSRITRIIDGLVEKRYILRREDADDRRVLNVNLTPAGSALANDLADSLLNLHEKVLVYMEAREREEVIQRLSVLTTAMRQVREEMEEIEV